MDHKEEGAEKEGCCESSGGGCGDGGCGCGGGGCGGRGKSCCAGKAAFALILLLLGGLIGYGIGHCGSHRGYCPMTMSSSPVVSETK